MTAQEIYAKYKDLIDAASAKTSISAMMLAGLFSHESNGDPNAIGDGGLARGLGQMHPVACKTVGADWNEMFNPAKAIAASADYLAFCLTTLGGSITIALMAYNQGPTVIGKAYKYACAVSTNAGNPLH